MAKEDHGHCCASNITTSSVYQTIDELEFERGIWSAALNGEDEKVKQHLGKGVNPNITDSSGYAALVCLYYYDYEQAMEMMISLGYILSHSKYRDLLVCIVLGK